MNREQFLVPRPAPRVRLPYWKILRCPRQPGRIEVTILSTEVIGVHTHFNGAKRILCGGEYCPKELHKLPKRWYGYYQGICSTVNGVSLLEVPESAWQTIDQCSVENSNTARGLRVRLERDGKHANAPVRVTLLNILRGVREMPDEIDIWPMIWKLYNKAD